MIYNVNIYMGTKKHNENLTKFLEDTVEPWKMHGMNYSARRLNDPGQKRQEFRQLHHPITSTRGFPYVLKQ